MHLHAGDRDKDEGWLSEKDLLIIGRMLGMELQLEPVFLNVYDAQESIPRNVFRQPV
jgi:hypothetical protein